MDNVMKRWICVVLAVILAVAILGCGLLSCSPSEDPEQTTAAPVETTEDPATVETIGTPGNTEPSVSMEQYQGSPEGYFAFVFQGYQPYQGFGPDIDLTGLELGWLYVHDEAADKVYPISHQSVVGNGQFSAMATTRDHLYFVLASDPTALIRTDYYGQERTIVYRSEYGPISCVEYHGTDSIGKVGMVENANRFVLYDLSNGSIQVMLEQPYIQSAHYHPNDPNNRPYIRWYGMMEGDTDIVFCLYYLDTGEFERRENW